MSQTRTWLFGRWLFGIGSCSVRFASDLGFRPASQLTLDAVSCAQPRGLPPLAHKCNITRVCTMYNAYVPAMASDGRGTSSLRCPSTALANRGDTDRPAGGRHCSRGPRGTRPSITNTPPSPIDAKRCVCFEVKTMTGIHFKKKCGKLS